MKKNFLNTHETSEFIDSAAAAAFLNISRRTLQRLRDRGEIPYYQPVRKTLYRTEDLREYIGNSIMPAFANEGGSKF